MEYGFAMRTKQNATALLGRIISPISRCLTPAAARRILSVRPKASANRRLATLAAKCDRGTLTPEERAEYQLFVEVGDLVALLQAKDRRHLAERSAV